jgi:hypothetical protein
MWEQRLGRLNWVILATLATLRGWRLSPLLRRA